ncbi:MAG: hypothetical protein C4584_00330 [Armatimonadetes bacterium]|nr:MAG: hypothetical protein C4584_00330 [Armatimonadota bacterium]
MTSPDLTTSISESEQEWKQLVQDIKEESPKPDKFNSKTLANFYLASFALQQVLFIESGKEWIEDHFTEDEENVQKLKTVTILKPLLVEYVIKDARTIAQITADTTLTEMLLSHTRIPEDTQKILSLYGNPKFSQIYKDFQNLTGREGHTQTAPSGDYDEALGWKMTQLGEYLRQARIEQNNQLIDEYIEQIGAIAGGIIAQEVRIGAHKGWLDTARNLEKYGQSGQDIQKLIIVIDNLIDAQHTNGSMLERTAAYPENAKSLMDSKKHASSEWVIKACADLHLVTSLNPYSKILHLQCFSKP